MLVYRKRSCKFNRHLTNELFDWLIMLQQQRTHDGDVDGPHHSLSSGVSRVTRVPALVWQTIDSAHWQPAVCVDTLTVIHWKQRIACVQQRTTNVLLKFHVIMTPILSDNVFYTYSSPCYYWTYCERLFTLSHYTGNVSTKTNLSKFKRYFFQIFCFTVILN